MQNVLQQINAFKRNNKLTHELMSVNCLFQTWDA